MFQLFKKKQPNSNPSSYFTLMVKNVVRETNDAVSIFFDPVPSFSYQSGQFITFIITIEGKEIRRSYSLSSSPHEKEDIAVTIKRVANGIMSTYLIDHVKKGDVITALKPMGNFVVDYDADATRTMIMIAGGSGITPIISILKSVMLREPNSTVSLIYCNRDAESIIFNNLLNILQDTHRNRLRITHVLDTTSPDDSALSGPLDHDILSSLLKKHDDPLPEEALYFVCGPEGMMDKVEACLVAHGIPDRRILKEHFVQPTVGKEEKNSLPVARDTNPKNVIIRYEGTECTLSVAPGSTILEVAQEQGLDIPYSCQNGVCTACRGKILSGKVTMEGGEGLSSSERKEGYVLTCVGHPTTDDVVIEIE